MSAFYDLHLRRFAVIGAALFLVGSSGAEASAGPTRVERCNMLQTQLAEQLKAHAKSNSYAAAASMEAKAKKLCAGTKQAQGIRLLAPALRRLGVQPLDPETTQPQATLLTP